MYPSGNVQNAHGVIARNSNPCHTAQHVTKRLEGNLMGNEKVKLYLLVQSTGHTGRYKKIEGHMYHSKAIKVELDTRPAMLKYKREIEFKDPAASKKVMLEGYFKRTRQDTYRQMMPDEVQKTLGWMVRYGILLQDLTLTEMDIALKS